MGEGVISHKGTLLEPWSSSVLVPGPQSTHRGTTPRWDLTTGHRAARDHV